MEQQERMDVEEYEAPVMVEAGDFREVTLGWFGTYNEGDPTFFG